MAEHLVIWKMDIFDAPNPEAAARDALRRILDSHDGGCHLFLVEDKATGRRFHVDLGTDEWRDGQAVVCELDPAE